MVKELNVDKSKTSHQYKSTSNRNTKEKQSSYNKGSEVKSSNMSSKRGPSPYYSTHRSKRSKSSSLGRYASSSRSHSNKNVTSTKTTTDNLVSQKVVKRQVVSQGSTEVGLKDGNLPSGHPTTTGSPSEPTKSIEQTYWKDFPAPKFYKNFKKFYDPIPKPGELPPSMYFPYDGPKLRRYKNYRPYKDPLSKYNDEEYYKKDFKEMIFEDLQNFNRKLELMQLNVDMASLGV